MEKPEIPEFDADDDTWIDQLVGEGAMLSRERAEKIIKDGDAPCGIRSTPSWANY